jgi:Ni,Fe-hydrogenase III large subunit
MRLFRVQSMYPMTPMYPMFRDKHMDKLKKVMRQIKLICMSRRLFWMHFEVHEAVQGTVHVLDNAHVPHVQGQAHVEAQEGHEAHTINQHKQEVDLDALRSA